MKCDFCSKPCGNDWCSAKTNKKEMSKDVEKVIKFLGITYAHGKAYGGVSNQSITYPELILQPELVENELKRKNIEFERENNTFHLNNWNYENFHY